MSKLANENLNNLNKNREEEEEADNTQLDKEAIEKLRNLKIDDSIFLKANEEINGKKKNSKVHKNKQKKGVDFMEYANQHGINVKIKYGEREKTPEKKEAKIEKKAFKNPIVEVKANEPELLANPKHSKPFNKNKKPYSKNNQGNKMTFNNKFDSMNSYGMNPYLNPMFPMNDLNNMMFYGQMPIPNMQPMVNNFPQSKHEEQPKGIKESLEYYFSFDNLNKDTYVRERMNSDGYVKASEILNFNNMKKQNANLEKIREVISFNSEIEEGSVNGEVCFRNKNWNYIKPKLISIDEIEQNKLMKKTHINYNYVTMQNNFFINPYQYEMISKGQAPMYNQPNANVMYGNHN